MRIETEKLIVRNFKLSDEEDLCEYMMQRVNAEFEAYPDFIPEKAKNEIKYTSFNINILSIFLHSVKCQIVPVFSFIHKITFVIRIYR